MYTCILQVLHVYCIIILQIATGDSSQLGQSEVIHFSDTQSHSQSKNQDSDVLMVDLVDVVLPNPSPRKKEVCGSFLNRPPAAASSPLKPRPGPSSPLAKQLDEILARSATTMEKVQSSPLKGVGAADRKAAGSPLASARRRLDLGSDKEVGHFTHTIVHNLSTVTFLFFAR